MNYLWNMQATLLFIEHLSHTSCAQTKMNLTLCPFLFLFVFFDSFFPYDQPLAKSFQLVRRSNRSQISKNVVGYRLNSGLFILESIVTTIVTNIVQTLNYSSFETHRWFNSKINISKDLSFSTAICSIHI